MKYIWSTQALSYGSSQFQKFWADFLDKRNGLKVLVTDVLTYDNA